METWMQWMLQVLHEIINPVIKEPIIFKSVRYLYVAI